MRLAREIVDEIFPLEDTDVFRASEIVQSPFGLSARDAVHIAIMERARNPLDSSFDSDFDRWPGLRRVYQI